MIHLVIGSVITKTQVSELIYPPIATVLISSSDDFWMDGSQEMTSGIEGWYVCVSMHPG